MAELLVTEAEKAAATYLEWDDASIGKAVKRLALKIDDLVGDRAMQQLAGGIALMTAATDKGFIEYVTDIVGLVVEGEELGDWRVTVEKLQPKTEDTPTFGVLPGVHLKESPGVIAFMGFGDLLLGVSSINKIPAISLTHNPERMAVRTPIPDSPERLESLKGSVLIVMSTHEACDMLIEAAEVAKSILPTEEA